MCQGASAPINHKRPRKAAKKEGPIVKKRDHEKKRRKIKKRGKVSSKDCPKKKKRRKKSTLARRQRKKEQGRRQIGKKTNGQGHRERSEKPANSDIEEERGYHRQGEHPRKRSP